MWRYCNYTFSRVCVVYRFNEIHHGCIYRYIKASTFCTGVCACIYCVLMHGMALLMSRQIPWDEEGGSQQETFMPDVKIPLEGTWIALHSHKKTEDPWTFAHNDKCSHSISVSSSSKNTQSNTTTTVLHYI